MRIYKITTTYFCLNPKCLTIWRLHGFRSENVLCPHCHNHGTRLNAAENYVDIAYTFVLPFWHKLKANDEPIQLQLDELEIMRHIVNGIKYLPETSQFYEFRSMVLDINRLENEYRWEILPLYFLY